MRIENSTELQEVSLSVLVKDANLMSKLNEHLEESFFTTIQYKLIFRALKYYYAKYTKTPSIQELLVIIIEMYDEKYGDLAEVKDMASKLYNSPQYDKEFITERLTTFVRRNMIEGTFKSLLPKIQNGETVAIDDIGAQLADNLSIEITTNESFTLADTSKLAQVREESVGTVDSPTIIKSCVDGINSCLTFKGYKYGDFVLFCSSPGSGKTMFMVNELCYGALQGFNVLHLFLGDMTKYDAVIRYTSRLSGVDQDSIVAMSVEEQANLIKQCNYQGTFSRIEIASYAADELTVDQMINEVYRIQRERGVHYDMIAVDYPDNLRTDGSNLYKEGGDTFNRLSMLARNNRSVVIAGSQPKIGYWSEEIIPKEAAAESSKKQHVVDMMITAGKPFKDSTYITYNLAKVRRGVEGRLIRIKSEFEKAYLSQCTEAEYLTYKADHS